MWGAGTAVEAAADDFAVSDDQGADQRVGVRRTPTLLSQGECRFHMFMLVL
jgi:hypothetical protein